MKAMLTNKLRNMMKARRAWAAALPEAVPTLRDRRYEAPNAILGRMDCHIIAEANKLGMTETEAWAEFTKQHG